MAPTNEGWSREVYGLATKRILTQGDADKKEIMLLPLWLRRYCEAGSAMTSVVLLAGYERVKVICGYQEVKRSVLVASVSLLVIDDPSERHGVISDVAAAEATKPSMVVYSPKTSSRHPD